MRPLLVICALLLAACASDATTGTSAAVTTSVAAIDTTTTQPSQDYVIGGCSSPPITFSALCEVYELVQQWHVDRPVDPSVLADVAIEALDDYVGVEKEPRPRTLQCAAPTSEFEAFCVALAERVLESEIAVGPAVDAAVVAMADIGLDPFSYYVPPEQVGTFRQNGVVGGVGVLLDATDAAGSKCARIGPTCELEVVFVLEDNAGESAGLLAGDVVISVDDEPVEGKGFAATAAAIAGDEEGSVSITVLRDGETLSFDIERRPLEVPTVVVDLPAANTGFLKIPDFEDDIPSLIDEAIDSLVELSPDTLVVDLRDNPGGYIDVVVEVSSRFVDGGIVMISDGPDEHIEYEASEGGPLTEPRLIVVVNQGTASAGEILAGALRDRRGAVIVGASTFGKDAVQIPFDLRNGGEMYVAVARWTTPNGVSAADSGLTPDVELDLPVGLTNEEIVRAALEAAS